jgi:site-specific DNA-methyltransferase (adenine-specific)
MKPLDGTFAQNAMRHGVAGLNVDGARIGTSKQVPASVSRKAHANTYNGGWKEYGETPGVGGHDPNLGRWPANLLLDEEAAAMLDAQSGNVNRIDKRAHKIAKQPPGKHGIFGVFNGTDTTPTYGDTGGASRFFYVAKASRSEREAVLEGMPERGGHLASPEGGGGGWAADVDKNPNYSRANYHPTVKPLALMRYLCTLTATPTAGTVLDPFMGSGTTGVACMQTGRNFIGCEIDPGYFAIAKKRIEDAAAQLPLIPHEAEPQHEQAELL